VAPVAAIRVDHAASSAALVRQHLEQELRESGSSAEFIDDTLLVASELVANAVRHAPAGESGDLEVIWNLDEHGITIRVGDGSSQLPSAHHPSVRDTHGRGLTIIAALSDEWGVDKDGAGKQVWAHVPRARSDVRQEA
jgi:anti-sigma regulatory factor (Ser/Thr protein kinase)